MLTRWAVPVVGIDPARVKLDHLHAVACRWVDDAHWASPKPWSLGGISALDGVQVCEVVTLTAEVARRLGDRVTPGSRIKLGKQHGTILTSPQPMATRDWARLAEPTAASAWQVSFLSPTSFSNGSRFSPWPDPTPMGRSLIQRWNAVHPYSKVVVEPNAWSKVWVSDIDGHSETLRPAGLTVSGFLGRIRYVCTDPVVAGVFDRLLQFAEFAGVGRYTTRGLGTVRLEPTWPADRQPAK